jgi:hypothetical protein
MRTYKNKYGDVFTFSEDDNGDILWEGKFEYYRVGYPNDYTKAFNKFVADGGKLSFNEFKKAVHEWDDETNTQYYPEYSRMVESINDKIDMVDPSGGPYISARMSLDSFGYKDYKVVGFESIETGFKIITEKCSVCNKPGNVHKMSCSTKKATVFINNEVKAYYDQMDKEVHQNRGNLNM